VLSIQAIEPGGNAPGDLMRISATSRVSRGAFITLVCVASFAGAHSAPQRLPTSPLDLTPPPITVRQSNPATSPGLIFVGPKYSGATSGLQGPEIIDDRGRPVWFHALPGKDQAADFRVQRYRGEPVLTWSEGQGLGGVQTTETVDYVVDRSYRVVAEVRAGNGLNADSHEFRLTRWNTALITIYNPVAYDLSPFGGPKDAKVVDGIVQEIDVASGRVLFEWHSIEHVSIDESQAAVPTTNGPRPYDYFHINAVNVDTDGNVLVSARNTWTIYKLDRHNGDVLFRLGGKKSDFKLGEGVQFAWQHDPEPVSATTLRIFDNEAGPAVLPQSRVIWIERDAATKTANLVRSIEHPDGLSAPSQGNSQALPNGDTFVGFGQTGRFSEFNEEGDLLFDASVPDGYDTYRAYRAPWHAQPDVPPTATATRSTDGSVTIHAIWNGATDIARWIVIGGSSPASLWPVGTADWNGLDTTIQLSTDAKRIAVVARLTDGRLVGRSSTVTVQ
jgi:hypothetical protein